MGCRKAQEFLEHHEVTVKATSDATKERQGRADALRLARGARTVVVAKGKKVISLDLRKDAPDDDALAALLLGPTGNLRAPTLRQGQTLYVGFSEEMFRQLVAR